MGCTCTNMMSGERMCVPELAWEDGIGVRGCPALRGTRGRSGRSTFLLLGARGGAMTAVAGQSDATQSSGDIVMVRLRTRKSPGGVEPGPWAAWAGWWLSVQ